MEVSSSPTEVLSIAGPNRKYHFNIYVNESSRLWSIDQGKIRLRLSQDFIAIQQPNPNSNGQPDTLTLYFGTTTIMLSCSEIV